MVIRATSKLGLENDVDYAPNKSLISLNVNNDKSPGAIKRRDPCPLHNNGAVEELPAEFLQ